uniref:Kelch repeat-containing protein At3g27220 isoform X1 n=1 Tax=Rhizophora mucronata TaxID=61149 RepID=A0A2P2K346_RHIMU
MISCHKFQETNIIKKNLQTRFNTSNAKPMHHLFHLFQYIYCSQRPLFHPSKSQKATNRQALPTKSRKRKINKIFFFLVCFLILL